MKHLPIKYVSKIYLDNFRKYYTIFYAQSISCLHGKGFIATPQEIDKNLPIQLEYLSLCLLSDRAFCLMGTNEPVLWTAHVASGRELVYFFIRDT
jgi:hypothetical protein